MEDTVTWRTLLGEVIRSPQVRQRIAEEIGVKPITLSRWATNTSHPRPEALRALPASFPPALQQRFILLIEREYPDLFANVHPKEPKQQGIPSAFYARFFHDYADLPINLRESSLQLLATQQLVAQLDPQLQGVAIFIAQCTPPSLEKHVSSLFKTVARGTSHWGENFSHQAQMFGVESLPGNALQQGHYLVIQNSAENARLYPDQQQEAVESRIAIPILLADQVAGCLCAYSTQPDYFTATQIDLLQAYADILTVTFAPEEFYPFEHIKLGVLPPFKVQRSYLKTFQKRVLAHLSEAARCQRLIRRTEAEHLAWQDLELLLLTHSF